MASLVRCVEPFDPPEIASPDEILVIQGTLDAPDGTGRVMLSKIQPITSPASDSLNFRVGGARVEMIVGGSNYVLPETNPGFYEAEIPVTVGQEARLLVEINGRIYESSVVTVRPVPEIDSLTFSADALGVEIEVNTHDPENTTKWYQWTFEETAEYQALFGSDYYWDGEQIFRQPEQQRVCWQTNNSNTIMVYTTDGLTEDVVFRYPIIYLDPNSWKIQYKYSVLVSQYSISEADYIFLKELENNTENIGTLFDPQPGRIFGNIQSVSDPEEYVIGQFSARSVTRDRLFIDQRQLPDYPLPFQNCHVNDLDSISTILLDSIPYPRTLVGSLTTPMGNIWGYSYALPQCMDCRLLREGTNVKPDFWE